MREAWQKLVGFEEEKQQMIINPVSHLLLLGFGKIAMTERGSLKLPGQESGNNSRRQTRGQKFRADLEARRNSSVSIRRGSVLDMMPATFRMSKL